MAYACAKAVTVDGIGVCEERLAVVKSSREALQSQPPPQPTQQLSKGVARMSIRGEGGYGTPYIKEKSKKDFVKNTIFFFFFTLKVLSWKNS